MVNVVEVQGLDFRLDLSREECWLLYVGLGEHAPFVRHQLAVVRHGGTPRISISTYEEGRQVLAALENPDVETETLTSGLRSLKIALAGSSNEELP